MLAPHYSLHSPFPPSTIIIHQRKIPPPSSVAAAARSHYHPSRRLIQHVKPALHCLYRSRFQSPVFVLLLRVVAVGLLCGSSLHVSTYSNRFLCTLALQS
ncbi:hypothetical protein PIB30_002392 [Stylosanthes scabra]|uniref:Uncharacterized protein n=1 Tax=Stylosanthes scabra TaxID=79078 RepID=A0ABU6V599_9FABA|nr:hypothetical protein [Stylosanthes scabra]